MKKKMTVGGIIRFVLIGVVLIFVIVPGILCLLLGLGDLKNAFVAKFIIEDKAAAYLDEQYPGNDFELEEAFHNSKFGTFDVNVQSRSSEDTHFILYYEDDTHELSFDMYESDVLDGYNTFDRLEDAYDSLVENALTPLSPRWLVGSLCRYSTEESISKRSSPKGIVQEDLILDQAFDHAFGNAYGSVEITLWDEEENVHIEKALEHLIEIDRLLTEANVGYYVLELNIVSPQRSFNIYAVTKEDLHCQDPLGRLQELWDAQEARRRLTEAQ